MAGLKIRKIDDETLARLAQRAKRHDRTLEEEAAAILRQAMAGPDMAESLKEGEKLRAGDLALSLFGAENGVNLSLDRHPPHLPPKFAE